VSSTFVTRMQTPEWIPLPRDYDQERKKSDAVRQAVDSHPLLPRRTQPVVSKVNVKPVQKAGTTRRTSVMKSVAVDPLGGDPLGGGGGGGPLSDPLSDPLSSMSVSVSDDPLSSMSGGAVDMKPKPVVIADTSSRQHTSEAHASQVDTPWQQMRSRVLRDYTVVGNITIGASSIRDFAGSGVEDGSSSKYAKRLAGLERRDVSNDKIEMTQKEYENHIKTLESDMMKAWKNDERVQTLKIAIQLAKLLADTNVPAFYPFMFVMVTDVLDKFGNLVFERLKLRAEDGLNDPNKPTKRRIRLPENFTSVDVPSVARETCRNWFYKTACIRELLPRIYVETALLPCFRFLADGEHPQILARLGSIARGLGDPLVSLYARTYLVVSGNAVAPQATKHILGMVTDFLTTFEDLQSKHHVQKLNDCKTSRKEYLFVMAPGVEWLLKSVGKTASKDVFQSILSLFREKCNDAMVLRYIIEAFDASYYAHASIGMATLIKSVEPSCYPTVDLFSSLGKQLLLVPPPEDQRLSLLNDIWKLVAKSDDIGPYIRCSAAWLEVVHKYYSEREVLILLKDLSVKLSALESPEAIKKDDVRFLDSLFHGLITNCCKIMLASEHLFKILDFFQTNRRVELSKDIMDSFKLQDKTNDAVLIHTMLEIGRILHDSVDSLSDEGEKRHISTLICCFIDKIDFGKDLEGQLNVYVECRSIFFNLDLVQDKLIMSVCALAVKAYGYMRGRHSKKTAGFTKACFAFCHITTPSIQDISRKLELLLYCSQTALLNQCLPQTDTFLKAAISLIPDVPTHEEVDGKKIHTEEKLSIYLRSLLSTLVVAPGHPEHGPFYIVQGLLNAMPRYPWQVHTTYRTDVYIDMLALLCTFSQRVFPYKIAYVESNDKLYGGTPAYLKELDTCIDQVVQEILKQLTAIGERSEPTAKANQAKLVLDFVTTLANRMEITKSVATFLTKLLELVQRQKGVLTRNDLRYMTLTLENLSARATGSEGASILNAAVRSMS